MRSQISGRTQINRPSSLSPRAIRLLRSHRARRRRARGGVGGARPASAGAVSTQNGRRNEPGMIPAEEHAEGEVSGGSGEEAEGTVASRPARPATGGRRQSQARRPRSRGRAVRQRDGAEGEQGARATAAETEQRERVRRRRADRGESSDAHRKRAIRMPPRGRSSSTPRRIPGCGLVTRALLWGGDLDEVLEPESLETLDPAASAGRGQR